MKDTARPIDRMEILHPQGSTYHLYPPPSLSLLPFAPADLPPISGQSSLLSESGNNAAKRRYHNHGKYKEDRLYHLPCRLYPFTAIPSCYPRIPRVPLIFTAVAPPDPLAGAA